MAITRTYILLNTAPADWADVWTEYYTKNTSGAYIPVTGSTAPTFTTGTYYAASAARLADSAFRFTSGTVISADVWNALWESVQDRLNATKHFTDAAYAALNAQVVADTTQVTALASTKADKVSSATAGDLAALDANGNLTDSGKKISDFATAAQATQLSNLKMDKVSTGTAGRAAALNAHGEVVDSGKLITDFALASALSTETQARTSADAAKTDKVTAAVAGHFASLTAEGNLADSGKRAADFATAAALTTLSGTVEQLATEKPNKPTTYTAGNLPQLTLTGSLEDSGKKVTDFATTMVCQTGTTDPTQATVAAYVGQLYCNTTTNNIFQCTNIVGQPTGSTLYIWTKMLSYPPTADTNTAPNTPGLVYTPTTIGGVTMENGIISVVPATTSLIDTRTTNCPITPTNLDYAVNAALGEYALLNEITIGANVSTCERTATEAGGTVYNLKNVQIKFEFPAGSYGTTLVRTMITFGTVSGDYWSGFISVAPDATKTKAANIYADIVGGHLRVLSTSSTVLMYGAVSDPLPAQLSTMDGVATAITKLKFYVSGGVLPANTKIKVYGIKK